jgi:two-component system phosphate regulon sensor histidine kinase PhoR
MNDLWLGEMFAAQAAVAIQNARLYRALATYNEKLGRTVRARTNDLQRVKERTEAILASTPDAIVLLDANHIIEAFNPAFGELFGYTLEEVIGKQPGILVDASQSEAFTQMLRAASGRVQPKRLAFTALRCNDTTFDADVAAAPVLTEHGEIIGVVCSLRDISALKEIDRMKDVFITHVSHQLRTPVTSIKLYAQMLRDGRRPEKTEHYLGILSAQADRLIDLIQDVLEIARFSSSQDAGGLTPVALSAVIGDVMARYDDQAAASDLVLVAEPVPGDLPSVQGDLARLIQALDELVQNAVFFTPSGGQVTIEVKTAEAEGQPWVVIAVHDTGPGIPPDEQPRVFERFFRGSLAESGHVPGAGLGLAIVQEIMELHQGFVDFASTEGVGSTFRLWLPVVD